MNGFNRIMEIRGCICQERNYRSLDIFLISNLPPAPICIWTGIKRACCYESDCGVLMDDIDSGASAYKISASLMAPFGI
jgi:hypothetical protein